MGTKFINYCGYSWIGEVAPKFKQVLIVLGNHDFWPIQGGNLTILNGANKCNALLQDMCLFNVKVLDMDTHTDGDYLFVSATLWTDMNKADPLAMYNMSNFMRYDGKCAYDTGPNGAWSRFTSEKWVQLHYKHRDYIKHMVEQNRDKKVIVITHHIPLIHLGDPVYINHPATAYYVSDLSNLILDHPNIKFWTCGHSHISNDLVFGETRMYMNPVGYLSESREINGFVKHEVIEI